MFCFFSSRPLFRPLARGEKKVSQLKIRPIKKIGKRHLEHGGHLSPYFYDGRMIIWALEKMRGSLGAELVRKVRLMSQPREYNNVGIDSRAAHTRSRNHTAHYTHNASADCSWQQSRSFI
jgi:hypothetical protein